MKILTLNANLKGVGTYLRCFYFSRELARQGHDVTMATVSQTSRYRPRIYYKRGYLGESDRPAGAGPWVRIVEGPGLGYRWIPGWGSGPLDILWRTCELWRGGYDLVYGFEYQPNVSWPFYLTRHFRRARLVSDWCDWHSGQSNYFGGWRAAHRIDAFFEERIRFLARAVTVISKTLHRRAAAIGIAPHRIIDVPEGIDTEYLRDYPREEVRRRHALPLDRKIVVAVKDGDMARVARIFAGIRRREPRSLLVVVGNAGEAPRAEAERLGIGDTVVWAGRVPDQDYPELMGCADVCLLPLRDGTMNEARFPAKLLDYLASARPVVTNPVGDIADLFGARQVGIAAGQSDEELADAAASLLQDSERARFLGANARQVMIREWEWKLRGDLIARAVAA